jgi:hypothetical protein
MSNAIVRCGCTLSRLPANNYRQIILSVERLRSVVRLCLLYRPVAISFSSEPARYRDTLDKSRTSLMIAPPASFPELGPQTDRAPSIESRFTAIRSGESAWIARMISHSRAYP